MSNWQIKIQDPTGETRTICLRQSKGQMTLGREESSKIPLRDSTLPNKVGIFWKKQCGTLLSPFWFKLFDDVQGGVLGDLTIREAHLPPGVPLKLGESTLVLQNHESKKTLPEFPSSVRPWLTQTREGAEFLWMTQKAAATSLTTYIAGETGTGKEVIARLIHAWSKRCGSAFVPLHCGALTLSLIESELFGHTKGAFTGAVSHRPGALLQAHGGTLFLDEVGDLPLEIQVKLLRFLEDGEIRPVGSDQVIHADVRIVCATNLSLKKLVTEKKFRQDLYYRLTSVTLQIPSLRDRPQDIELLAKKFASELGKMLSYRALLRLKAHYWPGNVRELRHVVERASALAGPFVPVLNQDAFEFLVNSESVQDSPELGLTGAVLTLAEMERVLIVKALKLSEGNRADAADILGIARSTLFEMLKRHKIPGIKRKKSDR